MNIIKHFLKVLSYQVKRIRCNHLSSRIASCPFTGYTYTTCTNCGSKLGVKKTDE